MEQMIGQRLGNPQDNSVESSCDRYQIKALLGKQIGRRTFLAEDRQMGELVVIKLVLFGPDFDWDDLKLFQREAQTLQSLEHPAIPKYLDSFDVETPLGRGFALVQTYIEAKSLREWVSSGHTFSESDLRAIATNLLHILSYLHQRQPPVIHRDIKPSNILLSNQGTLSADSLYLVDFGSVQTAPSSGTMTVVGTYGYMPPEQFGGRAQPASDLYSLGATLIYLITGQHPAELTQDNLQISFSPPEHLTPSFAQWIQQLTSTDLSKRIASAQQALQALNTPHKPAALSAQHASNLSLQLAHKEIKISSTPHELDIQFSEARLQSGSFLNGLGSILSAIGKIIAFLIGVALGGWFFLLLMLTVWPMVLSQLKSAQKRRNSKTAHLRLWKLAEGSLRLDLSVRSFDNGTVDEFRHYSSLPVRVIALSCFGGAILFDCEYRNRIERNIFSISGSSEDVQWLLGYIDSWTNNLFNEEQGLTLWNRRLERY